MTCLEAALKVLKQTKRALTASDITKIAIERGYWTTDGATPNATVAATLYVYLQSDQKDIIKVGKGLFAAANAKIKPQKDKPKKGAKAAKDGYIYILTNPSFREDWVKIGKTSRQVDIRSAELDNTAVPLPFKVYATMKTKRYDEAEKLIHNLIDKFLKKRIRPNREFFNIDPKSALWMFVQVRDFVDGEIEMFDNDETGESSAPSAPTFKPQETPQPPKLSKATVGFKVVLPGCEAIKGQSDADTFSKAIGKLGPGKVAKLKLMCGGEPLVSKDKSVFIKQPHSVHKTDNGWFVKTHSSSAAKIAFLKKIAAGLCVKISIKK